MKKLLLALLIAPFLLGCQNTQKNSVTPTDHYINVETSEITLMEDDTYQIQTSIIKKGTIVFYSSADELVATVSDTGLITAVREGQTTVTVRGGKDTFNIFVTVEAFQAHDSLQIVMEQDQFTLAVSDQYVLPLQVKLGNEVINNAELSFVIENDKIISINNLTITALKAGSTKCLVTASYNQEEVSKGFNVTVY